MVDFESNGVEDRQMVDFGLKGCLFGMEDRQVVDRRDVGCRIVCSGQKDLEVAHTEVRQSGE